VKKGERWEMEGETSFERMVKALQLTPEEYQHSILLKEWVRLNKDEKYVPSELLKLWGFSEDEAA
jgi:hypothetical protein